MHWEHVAVNLNVICIVIEKERKYLYLCELLVEPRGGAKVVLNFKANMSLVVLIALVLIKKSVYWMSIFS